MKVLFVNSIEDAPSLRQPMTSLEDIQMGISYISAVLKANGHSTSALVLSPSRDHGAGQLAEEVVEKEDPQVVAFTAVFSQYAFLEGIARRIRARWPDRYLIVGGPHASLNPGDAIQGVFDAVCVGEGEYPVLDLVRQLEQGKAPAGIANLWIKRDGQVEKNPTRPFFEDLDALPFPDREMWKPWIREKAGASLSVLLGRGCPFRCTYCSNHALAELACGKYVRFRSPGNILAEIRELHAAYPEKRHYYLEVETIALDKKWLFALCDQLAAFNAGLPEPISFGCNFRVSPQSSDPAVFAALKKANVISINIGLESGSERIRRDVLKRNYSNEDFLKAVKLAREHGIRVNLYNLIGIPGETPKEHLETVEMNRLAQPDWIFKSIFYPYPGTELHRVCVEQGLIREPLDPRLERRQAILDLPGFSKAEVQRAYVLFEYRVYRGHWPPHKLAVKTARNWVKSSKMASVCYAAALRIPAVDRLRARLERYNP